VPNLGALPPYPERVAEPTPADVPSAEQPTANLPLPEAAAVPDRPSLLRLFGTRAYFRLWLAQVVSSLGDWIGLVAIIALAQRVGGSSSASSVGLVMSARMVPGFFLAPLGGVLVDRWDRRKTMVACDIGRGLVLATLPFVDTIVGLVAASLVLEIFTLLWTPAKEASVPNIVPAEQLATANSLSLAAAYGTFPIAAGLSALLFKVAEWLGNYDALDVFRVNRESIAIYFDVLTFMLSACLISTVAIERRARPAHVPGERRVDLRQTFVELKEGWRFSGTHPVVRAVMVGLGTGLFGGGMVVPLGPDFSDSVLGGGPAGFSLLLTALGCGVAAGVLLLSTVQKRLPRTKIFVLSVFGGGLSMLGGASMSTLPLAMVFVFALGVCAGSVYVVGFTILHETVGDELRGRIFSTLYTLVRLCLLSALALAPFLSGLLNQTSRSLFGADRAVEIGGLHVALPGVRLTLWFGAIVILGAGVLALLSMRGRREEPATDES
jgi:dTMP kinase